MHINSDGEVVIPKKGKCLARLSDFTDAILMELLLARALVQVAEDEDNFYVQVEHGQIETPKDIATKLKLSEALWLGFYKRYDNV